MPQPETVTQQQIAAIRAETQAELMAYGQQVETLDRRHQLQVASVVEERYERMEDDWIVDEIDRYASTNSELADELRRFDETARYWNLEWVEEHHPEHLPTEAMSGS